MASPLEASVVNKPSFSVDQIVTGTDVVRHWRKVVEPRLQTQPYVVVMAGAEPKAAVMAYHQFESLWQQAQAAEELALQVGVLERALHMATSGEKPLPLAEVMDRLGITEADLEAAGDVDIETE